MDWQSRGTEFTWSLEKSPSFPLLYDVKLFKSTVECHTHGSAKPERPVSPLLPEIQSNKQLEASQQPHHHSDSQERQTFDDKNEPPISLIINSVREGGNNE